MKMRFYRPSVKQKLVASALFPIFSLLLLWLMLGYPMPTPGLAHRRAETARALPHLPIVASGTPQYVNLENGVKSEGDRWTVGRQGDAFFLTTARRTAGFLWDNVIGENIPPERPVYYYDAGYRNYASPHHFTERVSLVLCADPSVTRIELTQYDLPSEAEENESAFRAEHGVTIECAETSPGSGVWVGQQTYPRVESRNNSWSICTHLRAYTADGSLFYESPDRLLSME